MNGIPYTILLVDDDEDDREVIDAAFFQIGYGPMVKKFTNGQSLLRYLEEVDSSLYPSLIVLDNTLPGMDALDLLSVLKTNISYQSIPVVVYTTLLTPVKKKELLDKGAQSCMEKGSSMQEIVHTAMELKKMAEAAR
jgi:CheY-like chemotaxis protein